MSRNLKTQYAYAKWLATDGVTVAAQTLATTSIIPIGSIIKGVTLRAAVAAASSGSATVAVTVGGITASSAIAVAKLDTAGWVVNESGVEDVANVTTTNVAIGVTIGTAVFTGSTSDIDIIVEYLLVD
tara:strand:- start:53 stop:436 length:384 start_codon:yes stop_codon:yes gene_type:complete